MITSVVPGAKHRVDEGGQSEGREDADVEHCMGRDQDFGDGEEGDDHIEGGEFWWYREE